MQLISFGFVVLLAMPICVKGQVDEGTAGKLLVAMARDMILDTQLSAAIALYDKVEGDLNALLNQRRLARNVNTLNVRMANLVEARAKVTTTHDSNLINICYPYDSASRDLDSSIESTGVITPDFLATYENALLNFLTGKNELAKAVAQFMAAAQARIQTQVRLDLQSTTIAFNTNLLAKLRANRDTLAEKKKQSEKEVEEYKIAVDKMNNVEEPTSEAPGDGEQSQESLG